MIKEPEMCKVKLDPLMKEQALTAVLTHWGHCVLCKTLDNVRSLDEIWCKDKGMLS
jgi:hypothetical protein